MATNEPREPDPQYEDRTISSRPPMILHDSPGQQLVDAVARSTEEFPIVNPTPSEIVRDMKAALANVPWTLQQFFNGEIDLGSELFKRFPSMPLMSSISFRELETKTRRGVATLTSQDRSAMVMVDVHERTREMQYSFTMGSMLTFRFQLNDLSDMDRARWLKLMRRDLTRRDQGRLAFLWGQFRWRRDYLICIKRPYFASMLAFSPNNFEAAVRMTPEVLMQFLDWVETFWSPTITADEQSSDWVTW
ncbi:MAG: hypothetical protein D6737_10445 [Chloroflexi bacterium]|nr:MAG: hypothetical protein CUN54_02790 [Phototrophicales bacterium]RMF79726.1 MAG: hypothetical protein D6737_10445 [Chloroflexota bacterium]